jgi:hypothetical protein
MKGDAQPRRIAVYETPVIFRWPVVGEAWMVEQKNGTWYLDSPWPDLTVPNKPHDVEPGDAIINSPTGIIHVQGSKDGSTDFILTKAVLNPPPMPTLHQLGIDRGTGTLNFAASTSASVTVNHALGVIPTSVVATLTGGALSEAIGIATGAWTTTQITVYATGTVSITANVNFSWVAIA